MRPQAIVCWKGSGLALMLDLLAALLSDGNATFQIDRDSLRETRVSQVFLAFDLTSFADQRDRESFTNQIIEFFCGAAPADNQPVRYPGERTLEIRRQNSAQGIPVEPPVCQRIHDMADGSASVPLRRYLRETETQPLEFLTQRVMGAASISSIWTTIRPTPGGSKISIFPPVR